MSAGNDRPLVPLSAAEQTIALERLRADMRVQVAELRAALAASEAARALQAIEYERRLSGLNHEADQLKTMQAKYVSIDVYGRDMKENEARLRKLEAISERMWIISIVVGAIAAGIGAAVAKTLFP